MARAAVALTLFAALALTTATETAEQVPLGCFFYGWKISEAIKDISNPVNASDAQECQKKCQMNSNCKSFGFQPAFHDCWLGGDMQIPVKTLFGSFVSGPATCAVERRFLSGLEASTGCTASPSVRFPGRTPAESASTFTSGMVPVPLQCWPHYAATGKPALCKGSLMQVLEDTATGWPGNCLGLHLREDETSETCETSCRGNVSCSTFQVIETDAGMLQCWQGTGYDCYRDRSEVNVLSSKRFLRGRYRVLKDLRGFEVTGLEYAFSKSAFASDVETAVKMCNHTCLSHLACQAWRYSTGDGCWYDRGELAYPPTTDTFIKGTEAAALVVAGSYVQRICEVPQDLHEHVATTTFATTTTILTQALVMPQLVTAPPLVEPSLPVINATVALPLQPLPASDRTASATSAPSSSAALTTAAAASTSAVPGTSHPRVRARASAPVPANKEALQMPVPGSFVRVLSSGRVFFKSEDDVLHMLPSGCQQLPCGEEVFDQCRAASSVPEEAVVSDQTGEEFSCSLLAASGGSPNWWVVLVIAALLALCCWACIHGSWVYYEEIVRRCPGLEGYLPFQWCFGAQNSFSKLQVRLRDRNSRSAGVMYDPEDQLPLMGIQGPPFAAHALPTQQMTGSMAMAYDPGMPSGFTSSHPPGGMGFGPYGEPPLPPTEAGYDLVTVTPGGLQVTPLGNAPLPAGVPIVNPAANMPSMHQFG